MFKGLLLSYVLGVLTVGSVSWAESDFFPTPTSPETYCLYKNCTQFQKNLLADYLASPPLAAEEMELPEAFSGYCTHQHPSYHAEDLHHGLTLMQRQNSEVLFQGTFSFYASKNPWEGQSFEELKEKYRKRDRKFHRISLAEDQPNLVFSYEEVQINYWLRWNPREEKLLLISEMLTKGGSIAYQTYCRLQPHR